MAVAVTRRMATIEPLHDQVPKDVEHAVAIAWCRYYRACLAKRPDAECMALRAILDDTIETYKHMRRGAD